LTCAHLHCTILLQGGDTVDKETIIFYIELIIAIGLIITIIYLKIDKPKKINKLQNEINKIHEEITLQDQYLNEQYINVLNKQVKEQDQYLNKQIVTRQYREQKAKKDGK